MKTILLIEDTAEILENLIEYLELKGYRIYAANDGKKGVEMAKEMMPDLIICDALMPEMNGHEVLRLLMEDVKTCQIPFIFSTSMSEVIDKATALEMGADDYMVKPFEMKSLLAVVESRILAGRRKRSLR